MKHPSATASHMAGPPLGAWRLSRLEVLLLSAAGVTMLAVAIAFPSEFLRAAPECPIHRWTSFYCASCGTTRAIIALLGGNWAAAIRYNLLFTCLAAVSIPALCTACVRWLRGHRLSLPLSPKPFAISVLCVAILFMIVRNLPFAPWNLLAP